MLLTTMKRPTPSCLSNEELVARVAPRPAVPFAIRTLPAPSPAPPSTTPPAAVVLPPPPVLSHHEAAVTPLSPGQYRVRFTADAAMEQKLRFAKDLLRHAI